MTRWSRRVRRNGPSRIRRRGSPGPGRSARENWGLLGKTRWRQLVFQKNIPVRAPWEILPFQLIVETEYFLLRRGARGFERTGLRPAGPRFRRGGGASRHSVLPFPPKTSRPAGPVRVRGEKRKVQNREWENAR